MGKTKTTEQFILDAYCKHGDKYNYKLVEYKKGDNHIDIICHEHGIFKQKANIHLMGSGCKQCGVINKATIPKTTEQFILDAYCKHGDKYNYKLVEYINNKTKVNIICSLHGVFEQMSYAHLRGQGCKKCANDLMKSNEFHKKYIKVHGNRYDYSLVEYINNKTKVNIICPKHGIFKQRPDNHLSGNNCINCKQNYFVSKQEQEIQDYIKSIGIKILCNDRLIINPLELDIVIPDKKICIEYNGLYWHSESRGKDRKYHLNKYNLCKDKGYRLIQIFDDEWLHKQDIVKSRLKHILGVYDKKIGARQCIIKEITPQIARDFINKYHIQCYTGCSIKLGLFYDEELVSVMTFAKPNISKGKKKTNKKNYELSRFCTSCMVMGAGSKLLQYFIKNYKCDELYTFADLRWSDGNLYKKLGFSFVYNTTPNYFYIVDGIRKHRFNYRKNVLRDKLNIFDEKKTEYENMVINGYDRIWDCGNMKFIYKGI